MSEGGLKFPQPFVMQAVMRTKIVDDDDAVWCFVAQGPFDGQRDPVQGTRCGQ